ncbi:MAG: dTDP-4-dehydrorhamnose reductase [Gammaproteobacteria bacterium]|nr:dTDP-4-dehydrorhamnose reductase [Gammaproteobacteria bacterium]
MARVLILGKNGQVSTYLQRDLAASHEVVVAGREIMDLANPEKVYDALKEISPEIIINAAAYTAVDAAETDCETAFAINRDSVTEIARYAGDTKIPLIHYSTDYVFPGDASEPYLESDKVGPSGVYGQSKLEGEQAIRDSDALAITLRTSWVYSNYGKNFYKTMLALSEQRDELNVVNDQIGSPTYAGSISAATKQLVDIIVEQGGLLPEQKGVYHFTCQGQTSWSDFARAIFVEHEITEVKVIGIPTSEYPTPAIRPPFSVLNTKKLMKVFGVSLPHWGTALSQCVAETMAAAGK